jgi:hypothetical protein
MLVPAFVEILYDCLPCDDLYLASAKKAGQRANIGCTRKSSRVRRGDCATDEFPAPARALLL